MLPVPGEGCESIGDQPVKALNAQGGGRFGQHRKEATCHGDWCHFVLAMSKTRAVGWDGGLCQALDVANALECA